MRLLYLCSDFGIDPNGTKGASIHLRAITRALAELGHDVRLLSPKGAPMPPHPARPMLPSGCPPADESSRILKSWMVSRELGDGLAKEVRPLLYNGWALDRTLALLRAEPVDAIVERLSLHGHLGLDLAAEVGVPHIVEVNALLTVEAQRFRGLQLPEIAESIETRVLQRADAIVAVSDALAKQIASRGVRCEKIHVVPNGADLEHFANAPPRVVCRAALSLRDEDFVIGFLGTLKPWHGADALLEAFARLVPRVSAARVLLVGSGPEEARLRGLADSLGIYDRCTFTGAVDHSRVPELLGAMDVATAPYRQMDGFYFSPIKLFEYMAAGTCVVASRIGQIDEIIEHERNGLLCSPGDVSALAEALERVYDEPTLRNRLAEEGRQSATRGHSWAAAGQKVEAAISSTLAQSSKRTSERNVPVGLADSVRISA